MSGKGGKSAVEDLADASNAGIVTDEGSGQRHIPESTRSDGSTRKAIKIRPGYRPPEDVAVYKNRTAEAFKDRGKRVGIPGAASTQEPIDTLSSSAAGNKNAKRREARKKAKTAVDVEGGAPPTSTAKSDTIGDLVEVDSEVEREKKARNLKKKLKQARELKDKRDDGETLLPEQIAKVIKINELIRELDALGLGEESGEPQAKDAPNHEKD